MGRRAAEHVEADTAGGPLVPWRKSAPVAPLFAVSFAPAQGANGRHSDPRIWSPGSAPSWLIGLIDFWSRTDRDLVRSDFYRSNDQCAFVLRGIERRITVVTGAPLGAPHQ